MKKFNKENLWPSDSCLRIDDIITKPEKGFKFQAELSSAVAIVSFFAIIRGLIAGAEEHQLGRDALSITIASTLFIFSISFPIKSLSQIRLPKIIKWLGDRSYSIYLVHWPIILFSQQIFGSSTALKLLCLIMTIIAAEYLYRKVEYRYHDRNSGGNRNILKLFAFGQITTLCLMVALLGFGNFRYNQTQAYSAWERIPTGCTGPVINCDKDFPESTELVLLEGNSHAGAILHTFVKVTNELRISSRVTADPLSHLVDNSRALGNKKLTIISYFRDVRNDAIEMSYAEHWEGYLRNSKVTTLIVFLDNPYMASWKSPSLIQKPVNQSRVFSEKLRSDKRLDYLKTFQRKYSNLVIFDPFDSLCSRETCFGGKNGKVWYLDEDHLTVSGASQLEDSLRELLTKIALGAEN